MKRILRWLSLATIAAATLAYAEAPPTMVWDATYDSGNDDIAWDIAVDAEGSVYAAGTVDNRAIGNVVNLDWLVIKYNADGDTAWTRTWDSGTGDDETRSVVADGSGNVYASGWFDNGTNLDLRLAKYDTDGNLLWESTRDSGGDDYGNAVTVDDDGYVYLAGREGPGIWPDRFYYAKYDPQGGLVWEAFYDVENHAESAFGIAVDAEGCIYMHGAIFTGVPDDGYDLLTLKCDAEGDTVWSRTINTGKPDYAAHNTVAVDTWGNVYICGWFDNDSLVSTRDWFVVKYDEGGNIEWEKVIDTGYDDGAQGIAVDSDGFVYVTGPFQDETGWTNCITHKLDSDGQVVWESIYDIARGHGVAVDDSGFVYVSGHTYEGTDDDCLIIKYQQQQQVGVAEQPSASPLTLEVMGNPTTPTIRYSIPDGHPGMLMLYSVHGAMLETQALDPGRSHFVWSTCGTPSGVYFARLVAGESRLTARVVLAR
jgi:uncharacterized delta-60 repeat protein